MLEKNIKMEEANANEKFVNFDIYDLLIMSTRYNYHPIIGEHKSYTPAITESEKMH